MSGISRAVSRQIIAPLLEIDIEEDTYNIEGQQQPFGRTATDKVLENFTDGVLESFRVLERAVNKEKRITLSAELCHEQLVELAGWGMNAYQRFFKDQRARQIMARRIQLMGDAIPEPTFRSERVLFPWEVLYEGDNYEDGDPELFWGLHYSPARVLTPEKDISEYPWEQTLPSDMLFCLHHHLLHSHQLEGPDIEKVVVRSRQQDRFSLLGSACGLTDFDPTKPTGEELIRYLDKANHNMVHFACHCQASKHGDTLLFSFMKEEGIEATAHIIQLETYAFDRVIGRFQRQPLVFLNACQSVGGADDLRKTFNLPKTFIERGAAAVVATACPVPDLFAATFARVFYEFFLRGQEVIDQMTGKQTFIPMSIGEALRATRRYFLEKHHNPLGLAYGLYSPAHYRLAQLPNAGGVY